MAIDANDAPFSLAEVGDTSETTWVGEFRAKKSLSHRDQLLKDGVRRELLGGQAGVAGDRALSTAMILSELRVRLTKFPDWWTEVGMGLDLVDDNIIGKMYEAAIKIENDAIEAKKKKAEKVQEQLRAEAAKKKAEDAEEANDMAALKLTTGG